MTKNDGCHPVSHYFSRSFSGTGRGSRMPAKVRLHCGRLRSGGWAVRAAAAAGAGGSQWIRRKWSTPGTGPGDSRPVCPCLWDCLVEGPGSGARPRAPIVAGFSGLVRHDLRAWDVWFRWIGYDYEAHHHRTRMTQGDPGYLTGSVRTQPGCMTTAREVIHFSQKIRIFSRCPIGGLGSWFCILWDCGAKPEVIHWWKLVEEVQVEQSSGSTSQLLLKLSFAAPQFCAAWINLCCVRCLVGSGLPSSEPMTCPKNHNCSNPG